MEKLLLATITDDKVKGYTQYTLPLLKSFAKKLGADFLNLDHKPEPEHQGHGMWNYKTMVFYELLDKYDRILYLDSDIVINKNCPNIFDTVPEDTVGLVFEDKGSRCKERLGRINGIKKEFGGNEHWVSGFLNGGFYVVSRLHKDIFTKINDKLWDGAGFDGSHYCYQIFKHGFKHVDLGYKFNHMSMFSEPWNGKANRFDSHIIHYAGGGKFPDKGKRSREQLIKDDIIKIYGHLVKEGEDV